MTVLKGIWDTLKAGWDILRTVYWYNSLAWRILKSGALIVLGFFCLSGGNLVLSYKPDWTFLNYLISYGFLLIVYGPIHHLVVIPGSLRLAHTSWGHVLRINKRGPFWTLILFFTAVAWFGASPLDVMRFEFKPTGLTESPDINPEVTCYREATEGTDLIRCSLPSVAEIAYVEVENKGTTVITDRDPPFEFTIEVAELEEVVGQKNFHVILRDKDGYMIRRYVRSASMIDARKSAPDDTSEQPAPANDP